MSHSVSSSEPKLKLKIPAIFRKTGLTLLLIYLFIAVLAKVDAAVIAGG
jgi:hypothetical protein